MDMGDKGATGTLGMTMVGTAGKTYPEFCYDKLTQIFTKSFIHGCGIGEPNKVSDSGYWKEYGLNQRDFLDKLLSFGVFNLPEIAIPNNQITTFVNVMRMGNDSSVGVDLGKLKLTYCGLEYKIIVLRQKGDYVLISELPCGEGYTGWQEEELKKQMGGSSFDSGSIIKYQFYESETGNYSVRERNFTREEMLQQAEKRKGWLNKDNRFFAITMQ